MRVFGGTLLVLRYIKRKESIFTVMIDLMAVVSDGKVGSFY